MILARLWDKIYAGIQRNIPANSFFLSPREQELARYLFGNAEGLHFFGGYADAERKMLIYLPDYLEESSLTDESSPAVCLRGSFYQGDTLTHRDFLGALMGSGITRQSIGDISVGSGSCDFFVTAQIAPYILEHTTDVGRTKVHFSQVPLSQVQIGAQAYQQIKDTLASLRLDSVISSGFRISRTAAAHAILGGKVCIDGIPCEKPDKVVLQGCKLSLRGAGKIKLSAINGQTKKGRISVEIHRYV